MARGEAGALVAEQDERRTARSRAPSSGSPPHRDRAAITRRPARAGSGDRIGAATSARHDRQTKGAAHRRRAAPSSRRDRRCRSSATTPVAPRASALRIALPTLPGSCTSTRPMANAVGRRRNAVDQWRGLPLGDRDDAAGCARDWRRRSRTASLRAQPAPALGAIAAARSAAGASAARRVHEMVRAHARVERFARSRCSPSSSTRVRDRTPSAARRRNARTIGAGGW